MNVQHYDRMVYLFGFIGIMLSDLSSMLRFRLGLSCCLMGLLLCSFGSRLMLGPWFFWGLGIIMLSVFFYRVVGMYGMNE